MKPFLLLGSVGWGNRKSGLEAYGPGGRWSQLPDRTAVEPPQGGDPRDGDLLGDALDREWTAAGGHPHGLEGADLFVIAVPRSHDHGRMLGDVETFMSAFEAFVEGREAGS